MRKFIRPKVEKQNVNHEVAVDENVNLPLQNLYIANEEKWKLRSNKSQSQSQEAIKTDEENKYKKI